MPSRAPTSRRLHTGWSQGTKTGRAAHLHQGKARVCCRERERLLQSTLLLAGMRGAASRVRGRDAANTRHIAPPPPEPCCSHGHGRSMHVRARHRGGGGGKGCWQSSLHCAVSHALQLVLGMGSCRAAACREDAGAPSGRRGAIIKDMQDGCMRACECTHAAAPACGNQHAHHLIIGLQDTHAHSAGGPAPHMTHRPHVQIAGRMIAAGIRPGHPRRVAGARPQAPHSPAALQAGDSSAPAAAARCSAAPGQTAATPRILDGCRCCCLRSRCCKALQPALRWLHRPVASSWSLYPPPSAPKAKPAATAGGRPAAASADHTPRPTQHAVVKLQPTRRALGQLLPSCQAPLGSRRLAAGCRWKRRRAREAWGAAGWQAWAGAWPPSGDRPASTRRRSPRLPHSPHHTAILPASTTWRATPAPAWAASAPASAFCHRAVLGCSTVYLRPGQGGA